MNESQWLSSTNVSEMLQHLKSNFNVHRRKAGRRKLRLYSCACARRGWDRFNEESRALVESVELMLDGQLSEADVRERYVAVQSRYYTDAQNRNIGQIYTLVWIVASNHYLDQMAMNAASAVSSFLISEQSKGGVLSGEQLRDAYMKILKIEAPRQTALLRELFGNPFRPWPKRKFPAEVRGLAQSCVEDHGNYPVLADALEDLGESVAAAHCREPEHVRGCHVVDWILGRA